MAEPESEILEDLKRAVDDDKALARKILASPVRLKAWRREPNPEGYSAVCVAIVYMIVPVDEPSYPMTFDIAFKKSETRVSIKRGSSAKIEPDTVAFTAFVTGQQTTEKQKEARGGGTFGLQMLKPILNASVSGEAKVTENTQISEKVGPMRVQDMPVDGMEAWAWVATPTNGPTLKLSPWEASDPRLSIRHRDDGEQRPLPDPIIEIIAAESDLFIKSVKPRNPASFLSKLNPKKNIVLEQYISRELTSAAPERRSAENRRAFQIKKTTAKV